MYVRSSCKVEVFLNSEDNKMGKNIDCADYRRGILLKYKTGRVEKD